MAAASCGQDVLGGRDVRRVVGSFRVDEPMPAALLQALNRDERRTLACWMALYQEEQARARARPVLADASEYFEAVIAALEVAADTLSAEDADQLWARLQAIARTLRVTTRTKKQTSTPLDTWNWPGAGELPERPMSSCLSLTSTGVLPRLDFTQQARVDATYAEHEAIVRAILAGRADTACVAEGAYRREPGGGAQHHAARPACGTGARRGRRAAPAGAVGVSAATQGVISRIRPGAGICRPGDSC